MVAGFGLRPGGVANGRLTAGRTLHTLIGYTDQPTEMQLVVYATVLLATFMLMRFTRSQPAARGVATG